MPRSAMWNFGPHGIIPPPLWSPTGGDDLGTHSGLSNLVRFADFELDLNAGVLRRGNQRLKLQPQPAKILVLLVSRAGSLVSRQELAKEVWGAETYVDF